MGATSSLNGAESIQGIQCGSLHHQGQVLMSWWQQLRQKKLARFGAAILITFYLLVIGADFVAPYAPCDTETINTGACQPQVNGALLPPTQIYWNNADGQWIGPHVYPTTLEPIDWRNKESKAWQTGIRDLQVDRTQPSPIRLFVKGWNYQFLQLKLPYRLNGLGPTPKSIRSRYFQGLPLTVTYLVPLAQAI